MTFREASISLSVAIYVCSLSHIKENYHLENPVSPELLLKLNSVIKQQGWLITALLFVILQPANSKPLSLVMASLYTTNWYIWTRIFNILKEYSKGCWQNGSSSSKIRTECIGDGLEWYNGFDISGHTFLLTFAIMLLHSSLRQSESRSDWMIFFARMLGCLYIVYCIFILSITCLYYHSLPQKVIAVLISISSFWLIKFTLHKLKARKISTVKVE